MRQRVASPRAVTKHLSSAFGTRSDVGLHADLLEEDWKSGGEAFEYNELDELDDDFDDVLESSSLFSEASDDPCGLELSTASNSECLNEMELVPSDPHDVERPDRSDLHKTSKGFTLEMDWCLGEDESEASQVQMSNVVIDASGPPSLISSMVEDVFDGQSRLSAERDGSAVGDGPEDEQEGDPMLEMVTDASSSVGADVAMEELP